MAQIYPFRALRYNPEKVSLSDVVTQPYDKITPAMQQRYYNASPANLVRIILGKHESTDTEYENVYTRAASYLSNWRRDSILLQDDEPSIYAYSQRFLAPGSVNPPHERLSFIASGRIEDYSTGVVFRHEQTLSGPKVDRLNLLRATRAHFGQIFMLYSDPGRQIDALLFPDLQSKAAEIDVCDEYGVRHRVWKISSSALIQQVSRLMQDKRLIIADGHHRYETALNYRNERRRAETGEYDLPFERVMMTFVNMDSPGLLVLPTHRLVFGLADFDVAALVERLRPYFAVNPLRMRVDGSSARHLLQERGQHGTAFIAVTAKVDFILEAREAGEALRSALADLPPHQQTLDVTRLHKVILEKVLQISEEDTRNEVHLSYLRSADEAIGRVRQGANVAFLMNPVTMKEICEVAISGEVMPQKSTDFYPKLLSGLTIYALE